MGALSGWVFSIVGIVVLGVLVDVMIPEGQTYKYIKSVFAIITVLVICMPLPKLLKSDWDISGIFTDSAAGEIDENYLQYLTEIKIAAMEQDGAKMLSEKGFDGVKLKIEGFDDDGRIKIEKISIDLSNLVMNGNGEHININKEIVSAVCDTFGIEKEQVVIYGNQAVS